MRTLALTCVSTLALAGAASAQTNPPSDTEAATQVNEVVVTAQRREQRVRDVPLTVTALSSGSLKEAGVASIFDLTSAVSGLSYGGAGNHTQPSIRGVSASVSVGGAENSNSLYVDGVFLSQAQLLGANLPDVERIEVLKGPQGTLFGRNSVGGAIRIFTRNPTFTPTADLGAEYGYYTGGNGSRSAPHEVLRGFFSTPLIADRLAVSLSAAYDHTDGWLTDDATGDRYGVVERVNARAKLLYQPNDDFKILLNAYYLKHDDRGVQAMTPINGMVVSSAWAGSIVSTQKYHTAFDVGPTRDSGGKNVDWDTADVESKGISATATWDFDLGTLSSITAYGEDRINNLTTIHQSRGTNACSLAFACVTLNRPGFTDSFSQELNFASREFGRYHFTAGLFYYDQQSGFSTSANDNVFPGGIPNSFVEHNLTSVAGYGELEAKATDRLTLIVGGRYTKEERDDHLFLPRAVDRGVDFKSFLPRLSARYALSPSSNVYATLSKGEASGLSGVSNPGNNYSPVDPEENTAYEVGFKYGSGPNTFNIAAFYYDYKNKQEQGWTGTAVIHQNTGPVRIYGVDADGSYQINNNWHVRANASWVPEAEYRDFPDAVAYTTDRNPNGTFKQIIFDASGYRLAKAPELTANVTLTYNRQLENGEFDASGTAAYSSEVFHDNYHILRQAPVTTFNGRAGYTFADTGLRVGVYGRNLTNEANMFHAFASGIGFTANYAKPREVGVTVSYAY